MLQNVPGAYTLKCAVSAKTDITFGLHKRPMAAQKNDQKYTPKADLPEGYIFYLG